MHSQTLNQPNLSLYQRREIYCSMFVRRKREEGKRAQGKDRKKEREREREREREKKIEEIHCLGSIIIIIITTF